MPHQAGIPTTRLLHAMVKGKVFIVGMREGEEGREEKK